MKLNIFFFALVVLPYCVFANDIDLLNEYKLLYADISNVDTVGYKSYFNVQNNRAAENINFSQGTLMFTGSYSDFAVTGEGFFKIRLENDVAGYTRAGEFRVDADGNFVNRQGYFLYDNINLPGNFLPESLKIPFDGNVFVNIYEGRDEIREIRAGQIIIYNPPDDLLIRYSDNIFVLKPGAEYDAEYIDVIDELFTPGLVHRALEYSNVNSLSVVLRMYYILSVIGEGYIANVEFKKEMLKLVIETAANQSFQEEMLLSIHNNINALYRLLEESGLLEEEAENGDESLEGRLIRAFLPGRSFHRRIIQGYEAQRLLESRLYFLKSILPYLRYDY